MDGISEESKFMDDWHKRWEEAGGKPGRIRDEWSKNPQWVRGTLYTYEDGTKGVLNYWAELPRPKQLETPEVFANLLKELTDNGFQYEGTLPINRDVTVYRITQVSK